MPYRPPRPGDLLAARIDGDEHHAVIHTVADTGTALTLTGAFGEHWLDVVIRRVGTTTEETADMANWITDLFASIEAKIAKLTKHPDTEVAADAAELEQKIGQVKTAVATGEADAKTLGEEALADAKAVGHAGLTALKPVEQQAKSDVEALAGEAKADVKTVVGQAEGDTAK